MATPTLPPFQDSLAEFQAKRGFLMIAGRTAGSPEELYQIYVDNGIEVDRDDLPKESVSIDRIATLQGQVDDLTGKLATAEGNLGVATGQVTSLQSQVDDLTGKLATAEGKAASLQAQGDSKKK